MAYIEVDIKLENFLFYDLILEFSYLIKEKEENEIEGEEVLLLCDLIELIQKRPEFKKYKNKKSPKSGNS